jgi:hypothetical protein
MFNYLNGSRIATDANSLSTLYADHAPLSDYFLGAIRLRFVGGKEV